MPCDTRLKLRQTISERAAEVRAVVARIEAGITAGRVRVQIGPQGAIAFVGVSEAERDGVTDACAYRRIMITGNVVVRAAIARAEMMAGRSVDRQVIGHGAHSHDGGRTWHDHKG